MKRFIVHSIIAAAAISALPAVSSAQALSREQVQNLQRTINNARSRIDSILARTRTRFEVDAPARTRLIEASGSLAAAANEVTAIVAIQEGVSGEGVDRLPEHFVRACTKSAIAKSQLARARVLAVQPPRESLAPFGPDIQDVEAELSSLRGPVSDGGAECP